MKRIFTVLFILAFALLCFCGTGCNNQKIEQAISIKSLNDTIDSDINDLVSIYRNSTASLNEIKSSSNTITNLDNSIGDLKEELGSFNNEYDNELEYDSDMFVQYEEIVTDLEEWKDDLIDSYGDTSGLAKTYRISYNSNQAIIIGKRKQLIDIYKPNYQSIIE